MNNDRFWQTKLAARLHDPLEKPLILMRTEEGHEGGTSAVLREKLGLAELPSPVREAVEKADHWASAADRAAFPNRDADGRWPRWQQVRFHERPVIIHPLTGEAFDLGRLSEVEPAQAKALARDHLKGLIHAGDLQRTALAFWRFGPEIEAPEIRSLWAQLPADTRVPDHSIHDHLDLTAALAACFAGDAEGPALLAVSLGPVQDFIAAGRSTSDLWAGSHLLSRMSWEAMRVVCERLGPEAILFPRLRGVPLVDLWLRDDMRLKPGLFADCEWTKGKSDANPLFAAALPNRFTALVPVGQARELAETITSRVRAWVRAQAERTFRKLLAAAGIEDDPGLYGYEQIARQLEGFPEVHWVSVPWSLVDTDTEGKVEASTPRLVEAMRPFFESEPPGFLGKPAWRLLSGGVVLEDGWFWKPNPGSLYPALRELLERALGAVKSVRAFGQTEEGGWRDSLIGEAEWLTHDCAHLDLRPGQRKDTLWARVAQDPRYRAWVKEGEHLSALGALKRLWPTLFVEELKALDLDVSRFVVSSHTMALAGSIGMALRDGKAMPDKLRAELESVRERVALPRKLAAELRDHPDGGLLRRLPAWLDEQTGNEEDEQAGHRARKRLEDWLGARPEAYYGLLLMDGDRMGAWLSADDKFTLPHEACFHPQIRAALESFKADPGFLEYARSNRAPNPARHMAISEALNHFALTLAPAVAEGHYHGRILYAGGDDLMAMFPVSELVPAMAALRAAYSGEAPAAVGLDETDERLGFRRQANGFVLHHHRLLRVMGEKATASCGAVVAHHQAPLGAVLRELRAAESRAKREGGRDAFSLSIVKRSGGALRLTAKWGEPLRLLLRITDFLAEPAVSRRAVYNTDLWLRDLPPPEGDGAMAAELLAYQMGRQCSRKAVRDHYDLPGLAQKLVEEAILHAEPEKRLDWLENFLSVAEFLARETRTGAKKTEAETNDTEDAA